MQRGTRLRLVPLCTSLVFLKIPACLYNSTMHSARFLFLYADTEPPCFTFALICSFMLSLVNIFSVISPLSELQNFFLVFLQHFPSARTGEISYSADGNSQFEDLVKRQFFEFLKNGTYISLIMQFRSICRSRNGALHLRTNGSVGQFRLMETAFLFV